MRSEAIIAGGLLLLYLLKRGEDIVTTKLNPASTQNLAYAGVNALGSAATGDSSFNLGSWIYKRVDDVYGWFGASDADKQAQQEAEIRRLKLINTQNQAR